MRSSRDTAASASNEDRLIAPTGSDRRDVTAEDASRICGRIDDFKVVAIVEAALSYEGMAWLADDGDPLRELERLLRGKAAVVYGILKADLGEPRDREER